MMVFSSAKERADWLKAFEEAYRLLEKRGEREREGEDDVAFAVTGEHDVASEQMRLLDVKNRIENFTKVLSPSPSLALSFSLSLIFSFLIRRPPL